MKTPEMFKYSIALLLILGLTGCITTGRYSQRSDSAPHTIPVNINTDDAEPTYVEYVPANSRPYTVFGQTYFPMISGKGYESRGDASWYGQKFHGHLTANGEIYNMYDMTAAHKTLPLPSFVRVTNEENGKQAIVRVNDRGPFHSERVIDLSWAAAKKLDVLKTGTTKVKLEVIHVDENGTVTVGKSAVEPETLAEENGIFIQVAALQDQGKVNELARGLAQLYQVPTQTPENNGVFRLRLGPIENAHKSEQLLHELKSNGFENAYMLTAPH